MTAARTEDDAPRGFVPMREYLRLQRRVDELEARLAEQREDERGDAGAALMHELRFSLGIHPQGALALVALANARTATLAVDRLGERLGTASGNVRVVCWHVNRAAMTRGAPKLVAGMYGNRDWGGGYRLTPEGRAWLKERIPELFDKGAAR